MSSARELSPAALGPVSRIRGLAKLAAADGLHRESRSMHRAADCADPDIDQSRILARQCGTRQPVKLHCRHRLGGIGCDCAGREARRQFSLAMRRHSLVWPDGANDREAWFLTVSIPDGVESLELPDTPEGRADLCDDARMGVGLLWTAWGGAVDALREWWGDKLLAWDAFAQLGDHGLRWHLHAVVVVRGRSTRQSASYLPDSRRPNDRRRVKQAYLPTRWLIPSAAIRGAAREYAGLPDDAPYIDIQPCRKGGRAAAGYSARYAGRGVATGLLMAPGDALWWVLGVGLRGVHLTRRSRLAAVWQHHGRRRACPWCDTIECRAGIAPLDADDPMVVKPGIRWVSPGISDVTRATVDRWRAAARAVVAAGGVVDWSGLPGLTRLT